jgi:hypothetical protein
MRGKGINYDTGFSPGGRLSREDFDADVVSREMQVIASELRCTAVRITGGDPERLSVAGQLAAAAGLEVWFSPFPCELTPGQLAPLFADCADRATATSTAGRTSCGRSLWRASLSWLPSCKAPVAVPAPPAAALRALATAYLSFAQSRPAVYDAMFVMPVDLPFAAADTPAAPRSGFAELLTALTPLAGGRDLDTLAEVTWSALHGLATLARSNRLREGHQQARLDLLIEQLTGPAGAQPAD